MNSIFGTSLKSRLGQDWSPEDANPYLTTPVVTPVPAVPKPPNLLPDKVQKMDEALTGKILAILKQAKTDQTRIASWWDSHPNAEQILSDKLSAYSKTLQDTMGYAELADRLEFRISQGGDIYIKDSELDAVNKYQAAVGRLVEMVEGKTKEPLPATAEEKQDVLISGGVAVAAFTAALFL